MNSKSLKSREAEPASTATPKGPRPADFPLGSVESRAAARAIVDKLGKQDRPQPGDVLIQLEATGWPDRHQKIIGTLDGRGRLQSKPKRIPGIHYMWLALPEDLGPWLLLENAPTDIPERPKGTVWVLAISLVDLPFIWEFLTSNEQKRLLGHTD